MNFLIEDELFDWHIVMNFFIENELFGWIDFQDFDFDRGLMIDVGG